MLWANKKLTQSVTFTEDAADQALLEAIEKELSLTKYQTFSNLCKQALWQFLSVSGSAPGATTPAATASEAPGDRPFPPPPNLRRIEEGLSKLQTQLAELDRRVQTPTQSHSTEPLEKQVLQLAQQLAQFQTAIAQKLDVATDAIAQASQMSPPTRHNGEPPPDAAPAPPPEPPAEEETDPLLKRLSSLVDDF
ncbi:hypothetical protein [Lyngbya sp. CCY1209]|uniref:hypothetical protein n=1 Tax=Lyngbya sp. CCY1209 TaxID=2886103 RepID=UPI002D214846|nr:hypothetical protein [Lyngbya sp. CCY1209]MEB3885606.1 hypothetical protein [Lyngbya sp. CCY1209]